MIKAFQFAPAFGMAKGLWAPVDTPIRRHARSQPTLQAYCLRINARYFA